MGFLSTTAQNVSECLSGVEGESITSRTTCTIVRFPTRAMGHCGKTGDEEVGRRRGGWTSPERMESFLFPVLRSAQLKELPLQRFGREVTLSVLLTQ